MQAKELYERSPLRVFENSIHGGLGGGNIGVMVARTGVGKTAFLVGVAVDNLLRGRKVLHVAIDQSVEKVREYYDEIFLDLAHASRLEDFGRERLEMERNRNIHTFLGKTFSLEKLREAVAFLRDHMHFAPVAMILDGYDFSKAAITDLLALRRLAGEIGAEVWMSATTHREAKRNERGVPEPVSHVEEALSVILSMAHDGKTVQLRLLKDHDNPSVPNLSIALDPTTLLLVQE